MPQLMLDGLPQILSSRGDPTLFAVRAAFRQGGLQEDGQEFEAALIAAKGRLHRGERGNP